jgi:predicted nucleic acid-binding Zn ribbon protein
MDEEGRLRNLTQKAQAVARARRPRLLGEFVTQYMADRVESQQESSNSVAAAWKEVAPPQLAAFCRLAEVVQGKVKVRVSSPSYMHQLRLMEAGLLQQLQARCGRKTVKSLRFEIGR